MNARCDFHSPTWLRRVGRFVSWIVPGAVLALMPKCPACLAAYLALGTGLSLSLPVAENLRLGALTLSGAVLGGLALQVMARRLAPRAAKSACAPTGSRAAENPSSWPTHSSVRRSRS